jgi:hypothetical protein
MNNYDNTAEYQQLRQTHLIPFTSKEFDSQENANPSKFSGRLPAECISQSRSQQLLNVSGDPTHSLEIVNISITGLFTCGHETLVITLRADPKETNSLHCELETHQIFIPGGSYTEQSLVEAINFRTEPFFKLEWYNQTPPASTEKRLYLLSVLDSKKLKKFPNSVLHMSTLLATKLGFLIPSSIHKGPTTISLPLTPSFSTKKQCRLPKGAQISSGMMQTINEQPTNQQLDTPFNDVSASANVWGAIGDPRTLTSSKEAIKASVDKEKASQEKLAAESISFNICYLGLYTPSVTNTLKNLQLAISSPNMNIYPRVHSISPLIGAPSVLSKFNINQADWKNLNPNCVHHFASENKQTFLLALRDPKITFYLLDAVGHIVPLSPFGELTILVKLAQLTSSTNYY